MQERALSLVPLVPQPISRKDLRSYAEFLARDVAISHNPLTAEHFGVGWYQQQLGNDLCSFDDASTLRNLTIIRCQQERERNEKYVRWCNDASPKACLQDLILLAVLVAGCILFYFAAYASDPTDDIVAPLPTVVSQI